MKGVREQSFYVIQYYVGYWINQYASQFADSLGENREVVWQHIDEFRFMNTADIIVQEGDTDYSGLTKNSGLFSRVQKSIQALQGVYERPVL